MSGRIGSNLTVSSLQLWLHSPMHRPFNPASRKSLALRSSSLSWVDSVLKAAARASQHSPSNLHLCNLKTEWKVFLMFLTQKNAKKSKTDSKQR